MQSFIKKFLVISALILPIVVFAAPGIPHQFYGTVSFTSGDAPDGLLVEAKIDGVVFGSSSIKDGNYGYLPNLFFVTDPQSSNNGKTINFYVSGIDSGKTAVFENGASTLLNLTISGSVGTIEKSETQKIENETIAVAPNNPVNIKMGDKLNVNISSSVSTNANITKVEKLEISFFTGSTAIIAGNNLLNAFEIDITGDNLTISVTMTYDETGIDEDTINPYKFDGTSWVMISPFTINKSANTVTFNISSAGTPYVVFGQPPAPSGGGGGGGGVTTPTPTPSPLSPEAQKIDANKDNKIDILDFNTLMVNWGSTLSGNIADFNGDGKVDIFDFNLLMIYWTT